MPVPVGQPRITGRGTKQCANWERRVREDD
nr:MAG TPA: hypothetical protein [Caudoviricetes sp.]